MQHRTTASANCTAVNTAEAVETCYEMPERWSCRSLDWHRCRRTPGR